MAIGGLLSSQMLATTGLGADNNDFVPDVFFAPDSSGPNGSAVPGLGTNPNDPTQVGDTGSGTAADTTSGFDANQFFGNLVGDAFKAYQVSASNAQANQQVRNTMALRSQSQSYALQRQAQSTSNLNNLFFYALLFSAVVVVILLLKK